MRRITLRRTMLLAAAEEKAICSMCLAALPNILSIKPPTFFR